MTDRKRVLLVVPSLVGGGAERLVALLLQHLDRERFEPRLVLFDGRCDYAIADDVSVTCLNKKGWYDLPRIIWRLARVYENDEPDVVLSFMDYTNVVAVVARKVCRVRTSVLLSEVNHASTDVGESLRSRPLKWVIPWVYPGSDGVVAISQGVAEDLVANFRVSRQMVTVIYGSVDIDDVLTQAQDKVDHPWFAPKERPIIAILARLVARKGHSNLIRAFAQVVAKHPCRLVILGQGEERGALERLARELGVERDVAFLGFKQNPFKYIAQSDIFVLSSLWAGFELVIPEAMTCGVPVISTRCPSGPEEIITDGVNGLLVPVGDEKAMAEAMLRLLRDDELRGGLAEAGRRRAEDFDVRETVRRYEELFTVTAHSQAGV